MEQPRNRLAESTGALAPTDRESDPDSRVGRYVRRLDEQLVGKSTNKKRILLRVQYRIWMARYQEFVRRIDVGQLSPAPDGPDVNDYLLVIAAINTRLGRLS